jgi:protein TonB
MMRRLTPTNTAWRDSYGRAWRWSLALVIALHASLFFWLPGALIERLHEALIPAPTVFVVGGEGGEMELLALAEPAPTAAEPTVAPPEPERVEEVETPVPSDEAPEETTIAPSVETPSEGEGSSEAEADAAGGGTESGEGGGGGGAIASPRPLHLVVPSVPRGVDSRRAHGETVHVLFEVLPDGSVGEIRVEKGSRIEQLNVATVTAFKRARFVPATRDGVAVAAWTRLEIRF